MKYMKVTKAEGRKYLGLDKDYLQEETSPIIQFFSCIS